MKLLYLWAAVLLSLIPGSAQAEWRRATSHHFIVYSEGTDKALRDFTTRLERFDALMRRVTGFKGEEEAPRKLTVYLLPGVSAVQKSMGKKARNVAGYYTTQETGSIAVVPRSSGSGGTFDLDAESILYHEYAHHFMMQNFPSAYPAWFVEGFAEFYSTAETSAADTATVGKPAVHRFYGLALLQAMPVERMFQAHKLKMGADETENFYGRSWLLTHYLTFAKERKGQLEGYMAAINKGVDLDKAATESFGPLKDLDRDLKAYQNQRSMTYLKIGGMDPAPPAMTLELLGAAEGAMVMPEFTWRREMPENEVKPFAARVKGIAARYPGAPAANNALAETAVLEKNWTAAEAANDAYLAQRPDDARALLRRAEIAAVRLEADGTDPKEADWKDVRKLISKANRADVNDPLPLVAYYRSFQREGLEPTALATSGLLRALQLAPQNDEVRMNAAAQLIMDKKPDEARILLKPLAFSPHQSGVRDAALELLAMIAPQDTETKPQTEDASAPDQ